MEYVSLGKSALQVSRICLGSMTWGQQNSEPEAHEQLDYAWQEGVNFVDAAEMYPVPPMAETQGRTEQFIGSWMKARNNRAQVIVATKAAGPGDWVKYIRGGPRLDRQSLRKAVEGSLSRLQTDYIDLYQLHWPERVTNFFGQLGYVHKPEKDGIPIAETLEALAELISEKKIRNIGVSNETPWGLLEYLRQAEQRGLPRIISIQNPYSLLNRSFEVGLSEIALREKISLLAYSPLAFGYLSGKYLHGQKPPAGRLTLFQRFQRYTNAESEKATERYVALAAQHGLDPAQMALAYARSRDFMASVIIGATTMDQLRSNLASASLSLSVEVKKSIDEIHRQAPNPAP
ncbi:MAG: NADP(H)-dependent aldo-keto reductase [Leptospirales bacterium]|nr:NADP(H)-dependent aldo-keto reductase [Leptospirales bacterium]